MLYFALAIGVIIRLAGPSVMTEFSTTFADQENRDASAQSRIDLAKDALDCFVRNPIFGCGMENWGNVAPQYGWKLGKEVHNTWLELAAELGFFGILSIASFYAVGCYRFLQVLPRQVTYLRSLDDSVLKEEFRRAGPTLEYLI